MSGTTTTSSGRALPDTIKAVRAAGPVPSQVSVEAGAFIEDACPVSYEVEPAMTWIVLGGPHTTVNLQLSDRALINLATMTNRAARALLRERGKIVRDADGDTAE